MNDTIDGRKRERKNKIKREGNEHEGEKRIEMKKDKKEWNCFILVNPGLFKDACSLSNDRMISE
jgi:hypothetical protein